MRNLFITLAASLTLLSGVAFSQCNPGTGLTITAGTIATYVGCTSIDVGTGQLAVRDDADLPNLVNVTGTLYLQEVTSVNLPALAHVTGHVIIGSTQASSITLPQLKTAEFIQVLTPVNLEELTFPELTTLTGLLLGTAGGNEELNEYYNIWLQVSTAPLNFTSLPWPKLQTPLRLFLQTSAQRTLQFLSPVTNLHTLHLEAALVTSLAGLENCISTLRELIVFFNPQLTDISLLASARLESVRLMQGGLPYSQDLNPLAAALNRSMKWLEIAEWPSRADTTFLRNVENIGVFTLTSMTLTSKLELANLKTVNSFWVSHSTISVISTPSLREIYSDLWIYNVDQLTNIEFVSGVKEIGKRRLFENDFETTLEANPHLVDIHGFRNVRFMDSLRIDANNLLANITGLCGLRYVARTKTVYLNADPMCCAAAQAVFDAFYADTPDFSCTSGASCSSSNDYQCNNGRITGEGYLTVPTSVQVPNTGSSVQVFLAITPDMALESDFSMTVSGATLVNVSRPANPILLQDGDQGVSISLNVPAGSTPGTVENIMFNFTAVGSSDPVFDAVVFRTQTMQVTVVGNSGSSSSSSTGPGSSSSGPNTGTINHPQSPILLTITLLLAMVATLFIYA